MWKDLTLQQKAEIMKMSVANGVTDINDIRALYDGSVGHKFDDGSRIITLADLPIEYVQKYGHINVVTPKGVRMPLSKAYRDYNQTPINVNDVPGLTDYLIKQDQPDISEQAHINKVAADRKVHQLGEERDKALIGLAAAITGGGALASGLALAPVATIGSTIGGIAGEKAFNAGYEKLTGNNWGQDVEKWTNGYIPAEYGEYLNPGTLIGGITGNVASKVGEKIFNTALLSRAMNKSLNLTEIPNFTQPLTPKYRTRLGDVEINDPNLMYHQKANTNTSMFGKSGTGSILTDRGVIPGKSKLEGQQSYVWFNKGKPYVNKNSQYLVTTPSSNPNLIHVRSQNYPIGQWNGKTGFVTNSEYVSANPVSGTVYTYEPGYGYRRINSNPFEVVPNSSIQTINDNNAALTSPANWDWNRDIALFRGDKKELQRLRDLHFAIKAPNTKYKGVVYRGMDNNNPYIDMSKMQVSDTKATYVTPHKDYASFYSDKDSNVKSMYVNLENIWRDKLGKEYSFYDPEQLTRLIAKNISKGNSERAAYFTDIYNSIKDVDGMFRYRTGSALGPADFEVQAPPEILVRNNNALKLTSPITFDDFGNIIPLSKRDNFLSNDIRLANGGHLFNKGGYTSSKSIRDRISKWEGSSMYAPAPDTGKVNRPFSTEERDFWNAIPNDIKPLLTQDMADALFSTSYNIGAGNFKKRVVPQLRKVLLEGKGTVEDITNSMYGTRDKEPKMKGLRTRRAIERNLFTEAYNKEYGNPTTAAYHKIYGTPKLDISNDILYNPAQELQWTPITQESPKINPLSIPTNNIEIPIPKVEVPTVTPIEERFPLEARLPNIASLLSYLPDQQSVVQPKVSAPQYVSTPIDVWNEPYLLFGRT